MSIKLTKEMLKEMPIYSFECKGNKYLIKGISNYKIKHSQDRKEMAIILYELRKNGFKFFKLYGSSDIKTIDDLLNLLKNSPTENKDRFLHQCNEFWDCYGRIDEVGKNFFFRIYDEEIIKKIKKILNTKSKS